MKIIHMKLQPCAYIPSRNQNFSYKTWAAENSFSKCNKKIIPKQKQTKHQMSLRPAWHTPFA